MDQCNYVPTIRRGGIFVVAGNETDPISLFRACRNRNFWFDLMKRNFEMGLVHCYFLVKKFIVSLPSRQNSAVSIKKFH